MNWRRVGIYTAIMFGATAAASFPFGFIEGFARSTGRTPAAWPPLAEGLAVPVAAIVVIAAFSRRESQRTWAGACLIGIFSWLVSFPLNVILLGEPTVAWAGDLLVVALSVVVGVPLGRFLHIVDNLEIPAPSNVERLLLIEQQAPLPELDAKRAFTIFIAFNVVQFLVVFLTAFPLRVAAGIRAATSGETSGGSSVPLDPMVMVLGGLVGTVFAGFVALRMARRTLPGSIGSGALSSIGWSRASTSQVTSAAALGATIALFHLVVLVPIFPPALAGAMGPLTGAIQSGGWPLHVWGLLALVSAPIEEFVYRGVLFSGLSRSWGTLWSALFATLVFVLGHVLEVRTYWPALLSVTLAATAFVILRIRMKSLMPGVLCHAAYNAVLVAAAYGGSLAKGP